MSDIPNFKLAPGENKPFADGAELEGVESVEIHKVNSTYLTENSPGSVRPQRLITVVYKPPGTPQNDVRDFFGIPNCAATTGPRSKWTLFMSRNVNGVNDATTRATYTTELLDCFMKTTVEAGAAVVRYTVIFGMLESDFKAVFNNKT